MRRLSLVAAALGLSQGGCVMVGYSSRGGWFFWPGGLGLLVFVVLALLLLRRRR